MNIAQLLTDTAQRLPSKTALIPAGGGEPWTYARLATEAGKVAGWLRSVGVEPGDRVALALNNAPEYAAYYMGTLTVGAVVVPLNIMLTPTETHKILADSGAVAVLGASPYADAAASSGIENIAIDGLGALGDNDAFDPVSRDESDLAVLAYTSGTTGEPKGVMLSHGNLIANVEQQMAIPHDTVSEDDVLFMALPLFHIYGMNVTFGLMVKNGATCVLVDRFEPVPALQAMVEHKVTVLFGAPTMYLALVNTPGLDQYDLSPVRIAVSGAAPLSPEVLSSFEAMTGVPIFEGYGLTETSPTLMTCRMAPRPIPGSVGMPLPQVEVKLLDESDNPVDLGDTGEIVVRGPNVFQGYWNQPEETAKVLKDGWFHTGDIAVIDEEGYYYLVDRKRDLIIVSGFNVFPSEVEAALLMDDRIAEAAVIGVPHPYTGEAVKAYVMLRDGVSATAEDIGGRVKERLARFKSPDTIEIVEDLPHLITGKVLKRALRD